MRSFPQPFLLPFLFSIIFLKTLPTIPLDFSAIYLLFLSPLSFPLIFVSSLFLFLSIISTPLNLLFPIIWILEVIRELSLYQPNLATCRVESNHRVPWRSIIKLMSNSQRYPHIFSLVFAEIFLFLLSPSLRETTWVDMLKKDLINLVKILYAMWHEMPSS